MTPDPEEETREALPDPGQETRETLLDFEEETREVPSDPDEKTQEALPDPEEETREALSDSEEETKDVVARLAAESTDLEGPVVPALRMLTIAAIFHQIMSSRTWSRRVLAGVKEAEPQSILPTIEEVDEEGDEESTSMCDGGGSMIFAEEGRDTEADGERHVAETVNRKQAMNVLEMEEWWKARRKK